MTHFSNGRHQRSRGFSLLELLVVIAIMAVMMSLLLPAVSGFSSTAGRRGAVNILMNTFEQARVAALESGQTVYVGFADSDFPVEDMRYAAFIVFRDATDEEKAAAPDPTKKSYVVLKKWTRLPKNIAFKTVASSLPGSSKLTFSNLSMELGQTFSDEEFPCVAFNSSGAVDQPASNLRVYLYEGYYAGGKDNFTRNKNVQEGPSGLFEQISLSRYTGRAQLDITATGS
jgi:prepilin-type N-terminal cleavage/methylation domain-containing protein